MLARRNGLRLSSPPGAQGDDASVDAAPDVASQPPDAGPDALGASVDASLDASTAGAPSPRRYALAVFTGTELLVWGGYASGTTPLTDGALYNPATD